MANDAIINFLFNSQGAVRELNNFKTKFTNAISAIEESGVGKFARIGSAIAGAFSIKSFLDYTKAVSDFHTLFQTEPIEKIGRFANSMKLLNSAVDKKSSIEWLKEFKTMWTEIGTGERAMPPLLQFLEMTSDLGKPAVEAIDEIIEKARKLYKSGELSSDQLSNKLKEDLGVSEELRVAMTKLITSSDEDYKKHMDILGKMYVPTEQDDKAREKFAKSIALIQNAFERLGSTLAKNKFINGFLEKFTNLINSFANLPEDTQNKILGIGAAFMAIGPSLKILKAVVPLINPFTSLIALIGAFALDLGGIKTACDDAVKGFQDFIDEFSKKHELAGSFLQELHDLLYDVLHPIEAITKAWKDLKAEFSEDSLTKFGADLTTEDRKRAERILSGDASAGDYASGAWSYFTDKIGDLFQYDMKQDSQKPVEIAPKGSVMSTLRNATQNNINVEVVIEGNANEEDVKRGVAGGISGGLVRAAIQMGGSNSGRLFEVGEND